MFGKQVTKLCLLIYAFAVFLETFFPAFAFFPPAVRFHPDDAFEDLTFSGGNNFNVNANEKRVAKRK
jgi:hypothetical protein